MTVFKGYMMVTKKTIGVLLLYFVIFLAVSLLTSQGEDVTSFTNKKLEIVVSDSDNSELSDALIQYLKKIHDVDVQKDNPSDMQEEIYYGKFALVIRIGRGFEENITSGEKNIRMTQASGTYSGEYSGSYVEEQINSYLEDVLTYHSMGYSLKESTERVANRKQAKVVLKDLSGQNKKDTSYERFYQLYPYLFMGALVTMLAMVIFIFREKNVKKRMLASSYTLSRQNAEMIAGSGIVALAVYVLTNIVGIGCYGKDLYTTPNFPYLLINGFANMLVCLGAGFIVGMFVKKRSTIVAVITPLSLGLSFISGVFVPIQYLGSGVKKAASILPIYWYEYTHGIIMEHSVLEGKQLIEFWKGIGIQFLFFVAFIGIALVISKCKQQEK